MKVARVVKIDFRCPRCGAVNPVVKRPKKRHAPGHVKDFYCPRCRRVTKRVQLLT